MSTDVIELAGEDDRDGFWRGVDAALSRRVDLGRLRVEVAGRAVDLFAQPYSQPLQTLAPAADHGAPHRADRNRDGVVSAPGILGVKLHDVLNLALLSRDLARHDLAMRLIARCSATPRLASILSDPDIAAANALAKSVRRDMHKMTAFVRFKEVAGSEEGSEEGSRFVAWFEPEHHIVRATAPFFMRRFAGMRWSILTPRASAHWDGANLEMGPGAHKLDAPSGDPLEDVWRAYYASIFNPARLKVKAMQAQMPKKYWANLPEAELIAPLIRDAQKRSAQMIAKGPTLPRRHRGAAPPTVAVSAPEQNGRPSLAASWQPACSSMAGRVHSVAAGASIDSCGRCGLHQFATQVVKGEGPLDARLMIVGEQPGDEEDLSGRPFVGPAGRLLGEALKRTGIDRSTAYLTNAVKHFKFEPRGKRRLHKSPSTAEIDHCRWWLDEERRLVRPSLVVAMGRTAVRGLTGGEATIRDIRSKVVPLDDVSHMLVTVHPAYLLRLTEDTEKREQWRLFLDDWRLARAWLEGSPDRWSKGSADQKPEQMVGGSPDQRAA